MILQEKPEGRPESTFGWKLEFALVSLFSTVALVAYCVVYWPWRKDFPGNPIEFFAALPSLIFTAAAALSLGSAKVVEFWQRRLNEKPVLAWLYPAAIWALYALGTTVAGHANLRQIAGLAAYMAVPVAFALVRKLWADWLMIVAAWLPIQLEWLYLPNMPVPGAHEQIQVHPLFAACVGFWAIMVVRRVEGFQFRLVFSKDDLKLGLAIFAGFALVMLPLGLLAGFSDLDKAFTVHRNYPLPPAAAWAAYLLLPVGMYFGVALVEEALFRGLLQNMLARSLRHEWAALILASLVFGVVHFKPPSNADSGLRLWFAQYALFAALAGGCYGYAYLKTKRIMPGAVAHALVNSLWLTLFNPTLYGK